MGAVRQSLVSGDLVCNPTVADAVLDRLVHNAHRIALTGESLRKRARQTIAA